MNLRSAVVAGALSLAVLTGCAGAPQSGAPQAAPTVAPVTETLHLVTTKTAAPVTVTSTAEVTVTETETETETAASDGTCHKASGKQTVMINAMFDIITLQLQAETALTEGDNATANKLIDQATTKIKALDVSGTGKLAGECANG